MGADGSADSNISSDSSDSSALINTNIKARPEDFGVISTEARARHRIVGLRATGVLDLLSDEDVGESLITKA